MTDWRPIETAPKDGTEILGWHTNVYEYGEPSGPLVIRWDWPWDFWAACGVGGYEFEQDRTNFTHWMPLPDPPK